MKQLKNSLGFCILALAAIVLLFWLSFGRDSALELYRLKKEKNRNESILRDLRNENNALSIEIKRLHEDNKYFESVARRELGLVKDNEVVYRFNPDLENGE